MLYALREPPEGVSGAHFCTNGREVKNFLIRLRKILHERKIIPNFEQTTTRRVIMSVAYGRGGRTIIMMTQYSIGADRSGYFHLCSDGALSPQFLICEDDFRVAFNLVGVCAANSGATILSFSLEDTHLHVLAYGTKESCVRFKTMYETSWAHHIGRSRGSRQGAVIDLEIIPVEEREHLLSAGTYIIVQPTKDGKQIMPYDYLWGTGSMYFRSQGHCSLWTVDSAGNRLDMVKAGDIPEKRLCDILASRRTIPGEWLICNRILLPDNYVDVAHFERIYQTANCFRVFLASSRSRDQEIQQRIASYRGVAMEDTEARKHCHEISKQLFGTTNVRLLDTIQRTQLAQELRSKWHLSARQIASLVLLKYSEVCKYI